MEHKCNTQNITVQSFADKYIKNMKDYCQYCGCEVTLYQPVKKDYRYMKKYYKPRKFYEGDDEFDQHNVTELRERMIKVGNNYYPTEEKMVVGKWIAKDGINSLHGKCACGKRVFGFENNNIIRDIPAFRQDKNCDVVEVFLPNLALFEIGKHWYPANFSNIETKKINVNQLNMF